MGKPSFSLGWGGVSVCSWAHTDISGAVDLPTHPPTGTVIPIEFLNRMGAKMRIRQQLGFQEYPRAGIRAFPRPTLYTYLVGADTNPSCLVPMEAGYVAHDGISHLHQPLFQVLIYPLLAVCNIRLSLHWESHGR